MAKINRLRINNKINKKGESEDSPFAMSPVSFRTPDNVAK